MPPAVKKTRKKKAVNEEEIIANGLRIRQKVRDKIKEAIEERETTLTCEEIVERARKIETSIYNWSIRSLHMTRNTIPIMKTLPKSFTMCKGFEDLERKYTYKHLTKKQNSKLEANWGCSYFKTRYKNKSLSILSNLRDVRNQGFIDAIVNKLVPLREVANLKADEIFPELWKPIKERVNKKQVILGQKEDISDGIAQCGKCKSYKTTYYSLQTRSADEPMTNFFTCHNCGKHWKT